MSIFRDTFKTEISASLSKRQQAMEKHDSTAIRYLNSRNSWVRMTSAVNTDATTTNPNGTNKLATQYVLLGGTLINNDKLRAGVSYNDSTKAYSGFTPSGTKNRLGIRPMPGITNVDIKSLSAYGSLREVTVNFQCWDIRQLEELELLYMRPGYTVLIEWGWLPYLDNKTNQLINNPPPFYDILKKQATDRTKIFEELHNKCLESGGNYDAMYGYIKNYQWSARADGGYDCQTIVVSTGEIIESLKVNYLRADLEKYNLYEKDPKEFGFLYDLFGNNQGTYNNVADLSSQYEKNTVAGVWAEFSQKIRTGGIPNLPTGSWFKTDGLPGLSSLGDSNYMVVPGNPTQIYITLEETFNILNEYIIARSGDNNKEQLIKLSTKTSKIHSDESNLLCVAHPLQVSVDPTSCLIKSPLWYDDVIPSVASNASSAAPELIKTVDEIYIELGASSTAIQGTIINEKYAQSFPAAIKKIKTSVIFEEVNKKISQNTIGGNDSLENLIRDEFIGGSSDPWDITTPEGPSTFTVGADAGTPVSLDPIDSEIIAKKYHFKTKESNILFLAYFQNILKNNNVATLETTLKNTKTNQKRTITSFNGSYDDIVHSFDKSRDFIVNKLGGKIESSFSFLGNGNLISDSGGAEIRTLVVGGRGAYTQYYDKYNLSSDWEVDSISLTPISQGISPSIILESNNAVASINVLKELQKDYFYNGDYMTELGIIGNIYINVDFLYRQSLNAGLEAQDSKGKDEINLYSYVKSIISSVQSAIGNVSNFEIHVDPIDNIARVIDVNYTAPDSPNKLFKLQVHNTKSIVRNYSLQSQIFPNQSSIVAIGSQAQGGQLGMQNNTMIDFNKGLIDRIIPKKITGKEDDLNNNNDTTPIVANSIASIVQLLAALAVPPTSSEDSTSNADIKSLISKAKTSLRDIIVYFQTIYQSPGANRNIIPIKFSFEMDGIGGLIIGNLFTINDDILPSGYKNNKLAQTVTRIGHKLSNNDWTTTIEALNIIINPKKSNFDKNSVAKVVANAIRIAIERALVTSSAKGTNENCYGASTETVDTIYPKSNKYGGNAAVIVLPTTSPTVSINKNNLGTVAYKETIVTPAEYVAAAERVIEKLAAGATPANKKKILISAFAVSRTEQGGPNNGFKGFNNNISGIESDGFKVFAATDVNGKVEATEDKTNIKKYYYSFSSLDAGLVPLISKIMERNMFATGDTAGEWAWRWYRDWNGFGSRTKTDYISDCTVVGSVITNYNFAANIVPGLTKYKG